MSTTAVAYVFADTRLHPRCVNHTTDTPPPPA